MTPVAFTQSLAQAAPPAGLTPPQHGLWLAAKDDWDGAHEVVQADESAEAAWVHAYLHRVEGDQRNAGYWYNRAGQPVPEIDLPSEWAAIVKALIS